MVDSADEKETRQEIQGTEAQARAVRGSATESVVSEAEEEVTEASRAEQRSHAKHIRGSVIRQFGDLSIEANRVRYIEAVILDSVLPGPKSDICSLESAIAMLDSGTVNKLVTTFGELQKAHSKKAAILLEGFKNRNISQRGS
jgi:hypothetical protein